VDRQTVRPVKLAEGEEAALEEVLEVAEEESA